MFLILQILQLADKFGFTREETHALLKYYEIKDIEAIQDWYNGYVFGTTTEIFNPWSVMKCIEQNGALETYWSNTSENLLVKTTHRSRFSIVESRS